MAKQLFSNNASTTLAVAINAAATSIVVASGKGALFNAPTGGDYELVTLSDSTNTEVVKVTARSTDTLTVTRAQEGTTAQSFAIGAKVEARVTKGTLEQLRNQGTGTNAVSVGSSSVASGTNSIAVGTSSVSSQTSTVALGNAASAGNTSVAMSQYSVAIGEASLANSFAANAIARANSTAYVVGDVRKSDTGYYRLECIKAGTSSGSSPSYSTGVVTDGTVKWWSVQLFGESISVGADAQTYNSGGIAVGSATRVLNGQGCAIGYQSFVSGVYGTALGGFAYSNHGQAMSLGENAGSLLAHSIASSKLPVIGLPPYYMFGQEFQVYGGLQGYLMSEPVDLAGGATWAATTAVQCGYAVKPTTPNGRQYIRWDNNYSPKTQGGVGSGVYSASSTGSTEPTWPTTFGDSVTDGGGDWICVPHDGTYQLSLPSGAYMLIDEIGFIAYDVSSVSVQPTVSIGRNGALTAFVNAQQTSGLTSSMSVYRFTLSSPVLTQNMTIKIDTLATGTRLLGRFYFRGALTRHWV